MADPTLDEDELRKTLRRCPQPAIEAAVEFRRSGDPELVPVIVLGILERFVEPEARDTVREGADDTRLMEDLGIDSLLMLEIVIAVEETLNLRIENEELRHLRTLGDLKVYLDRKVRGLPMDQQGESLGFEEIAGLMPHQPPFLFLQQARIEEGSAEGSYRIGGDEAILEGHFKGDPIFPASLLLEALGQLCVLYLLNQWRNGGPSGDAVRVLFASCDGVRCHRVCHPGETLRLSVKFLREHDPLSVFSGQVFVNGERAAVVEELTLAVEEKRSSQADS